MSEILELPGAWAEVTTTGLKIYKTKPTKAQWSTSWDMVLAARQMSAWSIGDLYNAGEGLGEELHQFISAAGISLKTVRNHASVCKAYRYKDRWYPPSFTHHEIVSKLPHERRVYWLQRSLDEEIDSGTLAELTAEERGVIPKEKIVAAAKVLKGVELALEGCAEWGITAEEYGYVQPLLWMKGELESKA